MRLPPRQLQKAEMEKQEILNEIRRIARESGGKAPGSHRFATETGLRKADWYPKLWVRWGDAIREAGLNPNELCTAYDEDHLILKYIEFMRDLKRWPVEGELRNKAKSDPEFPSHTAFRRLGNKVERVQRIIEYCEGRPSYEDIVAICAEVRLSKSSNSAAAEADITNHGYVYLIRHGSRNDYKIGRTNSPIRREGELRIELPEKVTPVHYIETDDPAGVEKYWHSRYAHKRKEGEWFQLTNPDVRAFKRWRKIY